MSYPSSSSYQEGSKEDLIARTPGSASDDLDMERSQNVEDRHPMPKLKTVNISVAPISRLSADTMLSVFFLLMRSRRHQYYFDVSGYYYFHWQTEPWDWMTLAKVCRRWRDLALDYKMLWSDLVKIRDLDKIRVFLERSGRTELYVDLFPIDSYEDQNALFGLLEEHMWRVRVFRMHTENGRFPLHNCVRCLGAASKRMKVLAINHNGYRHTVGLPDLSETSSKIQLDVLSVRGLRTDWMSSLMIGLSELSLTSLHFDEDSAILPILDILEQSPMLRLLRLEDITDVHDSSWDIDSPPVPVRVVNLPQLQSVSLLRTPSHIVFALLQCIKIPKKASLVILTPMYETGSHDFTFLQDREDCHSIHICFYVDEHYIYVNPVRGAWNFVSDTTVSFVAFAKREFRVAQEILSSHSFWQQARLVDISLIYRYQDFINDEENDNGIQWDEVFDGISEDIERLSIGVPFEDPRINEYVDLILQDLSERSTLITGQICSVSKYSPDDEIRVFPNLKSITIFGESHFNPPEAPEIRKILRHFELGNSIVSEPLS